MKKFNIMFLIFIFSCDLFVSFKESADRLAKTKIEIEKIQKKIKEKKDLIKREKDTKEKERLEREKEKLEKERERLEKERERLEREKKERERLEREREERERIKREEEERERVKNNIFTYDDYRALKRELEILSKMRIAKVDANKAREESKKMFKALELDISFNFLKKYNLNFYNVNSNAIREEKLNVLVKKYCEGFSKMFDKFREIENKTSMSTEEFKKLYFINQETGYQTVTYIYQIFRSYIAILTASYNKYGDLKKYYREFDIMDLKKKWGRMSKILVYHFPYIYDDIKFLLDDADKYFKK